jgi:hypothetical protein
MNKEKSTTMNIERKEKERKGKETQEQLCAVEIKIEHTNPQWTKLFGTKGL